MHRRMRGLINIIWWWWGCVSDEIGFMHFSSGTTMNLLCCSLHACISKCAFWENKYVLLGPSPPVTSTPGSLHVCSTKCLPHPKPKHLSHGVWHNPIVNWASRSKMQLIIASCLIVLLIKQVNHERKHTVLWRGAVGNLCLPQLGAKQNRCKMILRSLGKEKGQPQCRLRLPAADSVGTQCYLPSCH